MNSQSGRSIAVQDIKQARDGCHLLVVVDEGYMAPDEGWSLIMVELARRGK